MNDYRGKHISTTQWASSASSYRGRHRIRSRRKRKWVILLIVLIAAILIWPLIEAHMLGTERVKLKAEQLPAEANNLRIVYLSDIHYGFWFSDGDLGRLVARINNLRPDLVQSLQHPASFHLIPAGVIMGSHDQSSDALSRNLPQNLHGFLHVRRAVIHSRQHMAVHIGDDSSHAVIPIQAAAPLPVSP